MSNHVKFQFLDYTFRPSAGVSTRACQHLLNIFDIVSTNQIVIVAIYALEIVDSTEGPVMGSRHVHIRMLLAKGVEPYNFFNRKYRKYPNGDDFVTSSEDNAKCFHTRHWDDSQRWKLGYLMKGDHFTIKSVYKGDKLTDYLNSCWMSFQDHESSIKVVTKKLAQVTKKNLGPMVMEFHELHWPGCHYNWQQVIIKMVQSCKYNFTFLKMEDIIQVQCGGDQVSDEVILEAFSHNQAFRPKTYEAGLGCEKMNPLKKRRVLGYITDLSISRNYLEELLLNCEGCKLEHPSEKSLNLDFSPGLRN